MGLPEQEVVVTSKVREVARTASRSSTPRRARATRGSSAAARPSSRLVLESRRVLTARQELLLAKVIDGFAATGQPVGSKALAADPDVTAGPSTIRNELAVLEEQGLLAHPHTSAGRAPTDAGYRYYVDRILPARRGADARARRAGMALTLARREVDEAMRHHDGDAVAGHRPAGDRLRAADPDDDDPPRRGAAAAAAGADGRDHHVHRRRLQARCSRTSGRSTPGSSTGRRPTSTRRWWARASARARCARG